MIHHRATLALPALLAAMVLCLSVSEGAPSNDDPLTIIPIANVADNDTVILNGTVAVDVFGEGRYLVAAGAHDDGIQVIDIADPAAPLPVGGLADDGNATLLDGAYDVAVFGSGGRTYVAVAAVTDDGLQIINITDPTRPAPVAYLADDDATALDGASAVAIFWTGGHSYAAVASYREGVQIINVTDPAHPVPVSRIVGDQTALLAGVRDVAAFERDGSTYLAVAAPGEGAVQLINVTDLADPVQVGGVADGHRGATLEGARGLAAFRLGGSSYLAVAAYAGNATQIINVTDPANPVPTASVRDDGTLLLGGAAAVAAGAFGDGFAYVLVASMFEDGVQAINVTDPAGPVPVRVPGGSPPSTVGTIRDIIIFEREGATYAAVAAGFFNNRIELFEIVPDDGIVAQVPPALVPVSAAYLPGEQPGGLLAVTFSEPLNGTVRADRMAVRGQGNLTVTLDGAPREAATVSDGGLTINHTIAFRLDRDQQHVLANMTSPVLHMSGGAVFDAAGNPSKPAAVPVEPAANRPPAVFAGTDSAVLEGADATLNGTASDPDGDEPLTYLWTHDQPTLNVTLADPAALTTTLTAPQVDSNTTLTFTLRATDRHNMTASDAVAITILDVPADDPPPQNFTAVLDPTGPLGPRDIGRITLVSSQPGTIQAAWEAPSEDPVNYRISWAKAGEPFLTWTDPSGNAFPTEPSYAITGLEAGERYKVRLLASYAGTAGDWSGEIAITVAGSAPANRPPSADAGDDQTIPEGSTATLNGAASDQDGDSMTYRWTSDRPGLSISGDSTLSPSFTAPQVASNTTITLTLRVTDQRNAAASDTVAVTVLDFPQPPTIPRNLRASSTGTTVTLTWDDPGDGTITGYKVLSRMPATQDRLSTLVNDTGSAEAAYVVGDLNLDTIYVFRVVAVNEHGESGYSNFVRLSTAPANHPPTADAGPDRTVNEGNPVTLSGTTSDQDGDSMTYRWTSDQPGLSISGDSTLSPSFTAPQVTSNTTITFTLTVTDGRNATASDTVTVTVLDVPETADPPEAPANTVVLDPPAQRDSRDIGRITLVSTTPGTIQATWEAPDETPANYRISWAKAGEPFLTWTDPSGNAFPTEPSYAITGLEAGERYKVRLLASYAGTSGDWSGEISITVAGSQ